MLDDDAKLPEGTIVEVDVVQPKDEVLAQLRVGLLNLAGSIKDLPPDYSVNFHSYIRGGPVR